MGHIDQSIPMQEASELDQMAHYVGFGILVSHHSSGGKSTFSGSRIRNINFEKHKRFIKSIFLIKETEDGI